MTSDTPDRPRTRPFLARREAFATAGGDTPRAFLEACLEAVELWEPKVGAFTVLDAAGARRAADAATERWRAGRPLSPIDGMPVGVKDIIDTADMPTQMGSTLYDGYVPRFDAASVQGLRECGAVILGKTVTTEFASSEPRGTRNPWDLSRTPGGSSSGSAAAVACGMVAGALGTQVVGSIIRPSAFCGVHGFKPGVGGINRGGSLDFLSQSTTGTIGASLADTWVMARAIAGRVGGDPGYPGLGGPEELPPAAAPRRLALLETAGWPILQPEARAALEVALDRLRAAGVEILTRGSCPELAALEEATAEARDITLGINAWEWRWPLGSFVARDAAGLSQSARDRHAQGGAMTRADYLALLGRRSAARAAHAALAARCDGLVSVTAPGAAPEGLGSTGNTIFVVPGSLLGVPVVTLPVLQAEAGLPLGLQLLGVPDGEAALFGMAAWVEALFAG
ncbi:amidase [Roseomonas sp. OT10]|uniref:amidase n=1 Tax=Roseomonas cutis TaxID=2897332 RepID=UPI001E5CAF00|nr:amidase [Roseomonas sp. OT10]UFN49976.1 amidase [Roseomonas sp. OT10]